MPRRPGVGAGAASAGTVREKAELGFEDFWRGTGTGASGGGRGRRAARARPRLAPGLGVNRDTAGTRRSLSALPGPGDGAHLRPRLALPAWHRAREGQALVWREVSHQRVGLPPSPQEVGARLFFIFLSLLPGSPPSRGFRFRATGIWNEMRDSGPEF